jgi:hypothetical protein
VTVNYQVTASIPGLTALVQDYTASGDIEPLLSDELQVILVNAENAPNANEQDGYLQDFINKVEAQSGKKVPAAFFYRGVAIPTGRTALVIIV